MKKRNLTIGAILVLLFVTVMPMTAGLHNNPAPELDISLIKGGFASVSIEVLNIGDMVAEEVATTISVKGGLLNRIDIFSQCSGCGQCNDSILPGGRKIESTHEFIFGLGSIDIIATANATGVTTVEKISIGFVIGPIVIIK